MIATLGVLAQDAAEPALDTPDIAWSAIAPFLVMVVGALVLLVLSSLAKKLMVPGSNAVLTVAIAIGTIICAVPQWQRVTDPDQGPYTAIAGAVGVDGFSVFFTVIIAASVILATLLADGYLRREDLEGPEPYVLMLLSASGGLIMASANDLIVMFLGLEILSLAVYVLAAGHRRRLRSSEAAIKYFVLGSFSSAFFLYGIALVYGATGSTNLVEIATFLAENILLDNALLLAGIALLLVGFGFKIAVVPFHSWSPDVYQGSPSPFVAFMASGVKAAGFAGLLRVFFLAFDSFAVDWQPIVYAVAVVTMVVGSVLAVVQTNVKRMLAYSSIAHAGYILVGVQAATDRGVEAALFYLAAYTFMIAGSFGVVTVVGRRGDAHHTLADYRGLARQQPVLALAFTVFLLAQAGVPLTTGFLAKFYVITAAAEAGSFWLALAVMVTSGIAAFLYLRIIVSMYGSGEDTVSGEGATGEGWTEASPRLRIPGTAVAALVIAFAFTVDFGILPGPVTDAAADARPELVLFDAEPEAAVPPGAGVPGG